MCHACLCSWIIKFESGGMVEQVRLVCSSATFPDDTPVGLGGAETGGGGVGQGGHRKG